MNILKIVRSGLISVIIFILLEGYVSKDVLSLCTAITFSIIGLMDTDGVSVTEDYYYYYLIEDIGEPHILKDILMVIITFLGTYYIFDFLYEINEWLVPLFITFLTIYRVTDVMKENNEEEI